MEEFCLTSVALSSLFDFCSCISILQLENIAKYENKKKKNLLTMNYILYKNKKYGNYKRNSKT